MRYALLYISWLGTWFVSEMARYSYAQGSTFEFDIWVEIARFMIFFSIAAFAFLAADKRRKTVPYQIQIEHIVFILGIKAIEHFLYVLGMFGLISEINPYTVSIANYVLAGLYIPVTLIRILYIKRKAFWT